MKRKIRYFFQRLWAFFFGSSGGGGIGTKGDTFKPEEIMSVGEGKEGDEIEAKAISANTLKQVITHWASSVGNILFDDQGTGIFFTENGGIKRIRFDIKNQTIFSYQVDPNDQVNLSFSNFDGDPYFLFSQEEQKIRIGAEDYSLVLGTREQVEVDDIRGEVKFNRRVRLTSVQTDSNPVGRALYVTSSGEIRQGTVALGVGITNVNEVKETHLLSFSSRNSYRGYPSGFLSGPFTDRELRIFIDPHAQPGNIEVVRYRNAAPPQIELASSNGVLEFKNDWNGGWPGDVDVDLVFSLRAAGNGAFFVDAQYERVTSPRHQGPEVDNLRFSEDPILSSGTGLILRYDYRGTFPEKAGGSRQVWEYSDGAVWRTLNIEADGTYSIPDPSTQQIRVTITPESQAGEMGTAVEIIENVIREEQPARWSNLQNMDIVGTGLKSSSNNNHVYDAGAFSVEKLSDGAMGYFEWESPALVDASVGLSAPGRIGDYNEADDPEFQIRLNEGGNIQHWGPGGIFERSIGSYQAGNRIRLGLDQRNGDSIFAVAINGREIYSSSIPRRGDFHLHIVTRRRATEIQHVIHSNGGSQLFEQPSPPSIDVQPEVTGAIVVGSTLTCTPGTWNGSDTIQYTYQWQRNGNINIPGATQNTYLLTSADLNNNIRCVVTATNAEGNAAASSNQIGPITAPALGELVYALPYFYQASRQNDMRTDRADYVSPQPLIDGADQATWHFIDNRHYCSIDTRRGRAIIDYIPATTVDNHLGVLCPWGQLGNEAEGTLYTPQNILRAGLEVQAPPISSHLSGNTRAEIASSENHAFWKSSTEYPNRRVFLQAIAIAPGTIFRSTKGPASAGDNDQIGLVQDHDRGFDGFKTPPHKVSLDQNRIIYKSKIPGNAEQIILADATEISDGLKWLVMFKDVYWSKGSDGYYKVKAFVLDPRNPQPISWRTMVNISGASLHANNPTNRRDQEGKTPFERQGIYGWNLGDPNKTADFHADNFGVDFNNKRYFIMYTAPDYAIDLAAHTDPIMGKSPQALTEAEIEMIMTPQLVRR